MKILFSERKKSKNQTGLEAINRETKTRNKVTRVTLLKQFLGRSAPAGPAVQAPGGWKARTDGVPMPGAPTGCPHRPPQRQLRGTEACLMAPP